MQPINRCVGDSVGESVGESVGDSVGERVGERVRAVCDHAEGCTLTF